MTRSILSQEATQTIKTHIESTIGEQVRSTTAIVRQEVEKTAGRGATGYAVKVAQDEFGKMILNLPAPLIIAAQKVLAAYAVNYKEGLTDEICAFVNTSINTCAERSIERLRKEVHTPCSPPDAAYDHARERFKGHALSAQAKFHSEIDIVVRNLPRKKSRLRITVRALIIGFGYFGYVLVAAWKLLSSDWDKIEANLGRLSAVSQHLWK